MGLSSRAVSEEAVTHIFERLICGCNPSLAKRHSFISFTQPTPAQSHYGDFVVDDQFCAPTPARGRSNWRATDWHFRTLGCYGSPVDSGATCENSVIMAVMAVM